LISWGVVVEERRVRLVKILAVLLVLALVSAAGLYFYLNRPFAGFREAVFIEIPKGASTRDIARMLTEAGVIEHPWEFLLARASRRSARLQAGEYRFASPASAFTVYGRIARGDVFYHELAIPEGQNMFDIAASVESLGLMPAVEFLAAARDPALIRDIAPSAPSLEGYLFPDTYHLTRHTSARELCRILTHRFRTEWKRLGATADVHQTVTLASLIEKEAAVPADRPLISSVFHNRLKMGMKLDCDPTTVYAALLEGRYSGKIHQSDLASPNAYNTYQHAGLPPGPIASPGDASLRATLAPAETDYIYFVARPDGSGSHQFSKDIAAHRQAATQYRRGIAK
jgi:UPF0755 protein